MSVYFFFLGYTVLRIPAAASTDFFEICRVLGITPKGIKRVGKSEDMICRLTPFSAARVLSLAKERGVAIFTLKSGGLPTLWRRFIHRPGIVAGTVLALSVFVLAQLFVWEVEITGCEGITEQELVGELAEIGLSCGAFLPRLDADQITLALRQRDPRVGYATVNVVGTVAFVQIKEAEPLPEPVPRAPANLVAKKDGVILLPMIFEGECVVEIGERVRAGQVLASGIIESEKGGFRLTRAAGQVMARTEERITVSVPLAYEKKVYTGRVFREIELQFFGLRGKVFKNTGNTDKSCDIIISEKEFYAGARTLPLGASAVEYHEYEWQGARRTATEALLLAKEELLARLAREGETRTLLATTVETVWSDTGVALLCTAVFEEDIGGVLEFSVSEG